MKSILPSFLLQGKKRKEESEDREEKAKRLPMAPPPIEGPLSLLPQHVCISLLLI